MAEYVLNPVMSGNVSDQVEMVRWQCLKPAMLNDLVYRPVDPKDPAVVHLAQSIRSHGLLEPIVVTLDDVVVSGHRRRIACRVAGLTEVRIRRLDIRSDDPAFADILTAFNAQRIKTTAEIVREEIAGMSIDPDEAYQDLIDHRLERADDAAAAAPAMVLGRERARNGISKAKQPMLQAAIDITLALRQHWPLTDRQIHYQLLNREVLRHASKPGSGYKNDLASYKDLCDLLTRARLLGHIPFVAITDQTRPVSVWDCHPSTAPFVRRELDGLFRGYARDLLQSQPCHVEMVVEKLTLAGIVRPVVGRYGVPLTIGRGYASLGPRHDLHRRYRRSGKDRLVVLFASDFDPEGDDIARSFGRSLRDDFDVDEDEITVSKVALTREQVTALNLPPRMKAKEGSSRRKAFVEENGDDVFELEAVPVEDLQGMIREAIENVLDMDAFEKEVRNERAEATELHQFRLVARTALASFRGPDASDPGHDRDPGPAA